MNQLMNLGIRHPWPVLLGLILLTLLASSRLGGLEMHLSIEKMMLEGDQARSDYQQFVQEFGEREGVLLFFGDERLLAGDTLEAVGAAIKRVEALPFVADTVSLFSLNRVRVDADGQVISSPYVERPPATPEAMRELRETALRNPLVADHLLSRDGEAMAVAVRFKEGEGGPEFEKRVVTEIDRAIAPLQGVVANAFQVGTPVIRQAISERILVDQRLILPASLGLLLVLLAVIFRRLNAALIPLVTAGMSVAWTLALMVLLDIQVNVMTSIVPALLVIVGSTEDIHLLAEYYAGLRSGLDVQASLRRMADHMGLAVGLTALTTALGFLSIASNPIAMLREFGLLAACGLAFNFFITSLLVPAWLGRAGRKPRSVGNGPGGDGAGDHPFQRLARALLRYSLGSRQVIVVLLAVFVLVGLIGASRIQVNNDPLDYFRSGDPLLQRFDTLQRELTGPHDFSIVLDAEIRDTFLKLGYLQAVADLQAFLAETGSFRKSLSFADIMALVNVVMEGDESGDLYLPESDDLAREYMLFLQHDDVADYVAEDYSKVRILVRHDISSSHELKRALAPVQRYLNERLPKGLDATITGEAVLTNHAADYMAFGQALSLGLVFLVIWVLVALLFVNLKAGLIALLPNLFPIVLLFGVMGYAGIALDTSTAMVAAIALGICVDDTMHFMVRFHQCNRGRMDSRQALEQTVRDEATPIFSTSLALAAGFGLLALSDFPPVVHFGLLSAMVMLAALLSTFVVTPMLLARSRLVSLWEMLDLRLQQRVQEECVLFRGLRPWQIKRLILLSEVRELDAGETLIRQGDEGAEMYVILEGELELWLEDDQGSSRALSKRGPGELLGEVALVRNASRMATATTLTPARVLVLHWDGVQRIGRMFPRLSSRLFLNLATVLGDKLADAGFGR